MKQRMRCKVWWPGIDGDIEKFYKKCYGCQLESMPTKPKPMVRTDLSSGPWQHIAADFLGPLPSGDNILVIVDYYSRWVEVSVSKSITAEKAVQSLKHMFSTHGYPLSITTDNGPQFRSEVFNQYMEEAGIEHHHITPLWPQANGEVERQNRSLMTRIRIAQVEGRDWREELETYLFMYRSTPQSTTGVSPAELLFGRKLRNKLPEISNFHDDVNIEVRDRDAKRKGQGKLYGDARRNAIESDVNVGDTVLVKQHRENRLSTKFSKDPVKVIGKHGNCVWLDTPRGTFQRNVTQVKRFQGQIQKYRHSRIRQYRH
ncbi:uncharacterized protein K02A2.6-like [Ylistrum balloti]|uniref:uncharacterized protein K02A2.6-like n=1 Tax=Ylistrum balloti TaxID=509963 RepID=UPI002905F794|nr:uncharacterized protein K02A2.6-like [Ylistrum balloti]